MTALLKQLPDGIPGPIGFPGEVYQTFEGELTPVLPSCLQKTEEKETLPSSFLEASKEPKTVGKGEKRKEN